MKLNCNAWKVNSDKENAPNFSAYFKNEEGERDFYLCNLVKVDDKGQKYLSLSLDTDGIKAYQKREKVELVLNRKLMKMISPSKEDQQAAELTYLYKDALLCTKCKDWFRNRDDKDSIEQTKMCIYCLETDPAYILDLISSLSE